MEKQKKHLSGAGILILILLAGMAVFFIAKYRSLISKTPDITAAPAVTTDAEGNDVLLQVTPNPDQALEYETNKAINPDYIGILYFDSGLLGQYVVQGDDNEKYMNLSWDLKEDTHGAAFIDNRNSLDDQNIIIYGHYVYYDDDAMFSRLARLMEEENYEDNKYLSLAIGPSEVRHYVITDVFEYHENTDRPDWHELSYDEQKFYYFYNDVKAADYYDTGETLSYTDHWLSLQTCKRNDPAVRQVILCRQITE